jgi:sporulation protein YlmC with PRC-barrel domain
MEDTGATQFNIGVDVVGTDGTCGRMIRAVVDPVARTLTHLVVEPEHRQGLGRLVPLDLVLQAATEQITLRCSVKEFENLERAEETHFLPASAGHLGYVPEELLALPYYGLGPGNTTPPVTEDSLPMGEVSVRRDEPVHALDGEIGRVQGLVIDPGSHRVTHLLLQEGHLFGHKEVAIPIRAITGIDDGIRLTLSKKDVQELPSVAFDALH